MALGKIKEVLSQELDTMKQRGLFKREETVITGVVPPRGTRGTRFLAEGYGDKEFLRMNSNNYLGMSMRKAVIKAEEDAARRFGAGPGAARFISGTYRPHVELERRLAAFHHREAAMLFSSAYATMIGIIPPLVSPDTIVISDELNHNCIISAIRLARPRDKKVYRHNNMAQLEAALNECAGNARRIVIVTDGVFSMRGDYTPLSQIAELADKYKGKFEEGIITIIDDSHGVGALGETGRGTTEVTGVDNIDMIVATLGKALGVNGGYLVSDAVVVDYLRETAPTYIYSNPITAAEASASKKALEILDSAAGRELLGYLHHLAAYFREGLVRRGYEVIPGIHPIVPLMVRDTRKTIELVRYLKENGILATGLSYPVVPRGDEEIRFQVCTDHSRHDIDYVLETLGRYGRPGQ